MSAFISLLQPSDEMVEKFDKLLILSSGGDMLYFGKCDRDLLRSIFLSPDNPDGDKGSIADLVLQASLDKTGETENDIKQRFEESSTAAQLAADISKLRRTCAKGMGVEDLLPHDYPNSFGYRFKCISERRMKLIGRNAVTWTRILIAPAVRAGHWFSVRRHAKQSRRRTQQKRVYLPALLHSPSC